MPSVVEQGPEREREDEIRAKAKVGMRTRSDAKVWAETSYGTDTALPLGQHCAPQDEGFSCI